MFQAVMRMDQKTGRWSAVVTNDGKMVAEFSEEQWLQQGAVKFAIDLSKEQLEQQAPAA